MKRKVFLAHLQASMSHYDGAWRKHRLAIAPDDQGDTAMIKLADTKTKLRIGDVIKFQVIDNWFLIETHCAKLMFQSLTGSVEVEILCQAPADVKEITEDELIEKIAEMRAEQTAFFKTKKKVHLFRAKELEREVDRIIGAIKNPTLF